VPGTSLTLPGPKATACQSCSVLQDSCKCLAPRFGGGQAQVPGTSSTRLGPKTTVWQGCSVPQNGRTSAWHLTRKRPAHVGRSAKEETDEHHAQAQQPLASFPQTTQTAQTLPPIRVVPQRAPVLPAHLVTPEVGHPAILPPPLPPHDHPPAARTPRHLRRVRPCHHQMPVHSRLPHHTPPRHKRAHRPHDRRATPRRIRPPATPSRTPQATA
jgi:hypothetical protein